MREATGRWALHSIQQTYRDRVLLPESERHWYICESPDQHIRDLAEVVHVLRTFCVEHNGVGPRIVGVVRLPSLQD